LALFLVLPLACAIKQASGYSPSSSIYYPFFGGALMPLFYALSLVTVLGLLRVVIISDKWIRIEGDQLLIGLNKPIDRTDVFAISITDSKLNVVLGDSRVVWTSVDKLNLDCEEIMRRLSSWRADTL
jgi:hypothetical protein